MKLGILIKNGRVVDPARGVDAICDIGTHGDRIVDVGKDRDVEAQYVVNAEGRYVFPGLVDFHTHMFFGGSDFALPPDLFSLPMGVTTAVDAGTAGTANIGALRQLCAGTQVRLKYQLNLSPAGLATHFYNEPIDPKCWDRDKLIQICLNEQDDLMGFKIRQSKDIARTLNLSPLEEAVRLSDEIRSRYPVNDRSTRIVVHTTNPPEHVSRIAALLRKGDVYTHVYQGNGMNIIENGRVHPAIREARERGVMFDAANGKGHFSFDVAEAALADGFPPDVISTDITTISHAAYAVGLPHLMSRYLHLGMSLDDVVKAVTATPAALLGMSGQIGTLAPGSFADICVCSLRSQEVTFTDTAGEKRTGSRILVPELVVASGNIAFRQMYIHIEQQRQRL